MSTHNRKLTSHQLGRSYLYYYHGQHGHNNELACQYAKKFLQEGRSIGDWRPYPLYCQIVDCAMDNQYLLNRIIFDYLEDLDGDSLSSDAESDSESDSDDETHDTAKYAKFRRDTDHLTSSERKEMWEIFDQYDSAAQRIHRCKNQPALKAMLANYTTRRFIDEFMPRD